MRRIGMFALCLTLAACGDDNKVDGTLGGVHYNNAEAIFAVVDASLDANNVASGQVGIVLLSSATGTCDAIAANNTYANTAWTLGFLYNHPQDNSVSFDVGGYALETKDVIAAQVEAGDPRPQRVGYGSVYTYDAYCRADGDSPYAITQGTASVRSIDAGKSMKLSFDITSDANDRLVGTVTASYCKALGALFDGSASSTSTSAPGCLKPEGS